MLKISQRDTRWKDEHLGKSKATVGRYGCLITCLSMITEYCGEYRDPKWMAKNLLFTEEGKLYWNSMDKKTCMGFQYRYYVRNDERIRRALLNPLEAIILQVDSFHWVWAIGTIGDHYKIHDPWVGDATTSKRYRNITGFAIINLKKSIPEPTWFGKINVLLRNSTAFLFSVACHTCEPRAIKFYSRRCFLVCQRTRTLVLLKIYCKSRKAGQRENQTGGRELWKERPIAF